MFTGIIENVGVVGSVRSGSGGLVVEVDLGVIADADGVGVGDSICVNGVCLTVSVLNGSKALFDVSGETVGVSTLGKVRAGMNVNLERAMIAGGRFGGHIVQGHVDGVGSIVKIERKWGGAEIRFSADKGLIDEMILKGSVAVDGVSLTVAGLDTRGFSVAVIPTTLKETTLGAARVGDKVNIETDIITKAVRSQVEKMLKDKGGISWEKF